MHLNDYQIESRKTACYPDPGGITYVALALAGEAGEVANRIKKVMRRAMNAAPDVSAFTLEERGAIVDEMGDCLWYLAALADELGTSLDVVAQVNLDKLADRQAAGTIKDHA